MPETGIVERLRGNGRTPEDSAMIVSTTRAQDCWPTKIDVEAASVIDRQQKAIDLLLDGIGPFASATTRFGIDDKDLEAARSAKEQAERVLKGEES